MVELTANPTGRRTFQAGREQGLIPNGVLAMIIFVACEVMFFAALISAYMVISSGATNWPPPDQPRLPVLSTAFNTLILLVSGCCLFGAHRCFARSDMPTMKKLLAAAILLGCFFILFQGVEWVRLIHYGLTMRSSTYGSFFYLIIGAHGAHALAAIIVLSLAWLKLKRGILHTSFFGASLVFWYFVVGVWPFLYVMVYLD